MLSLALLAWSVSGHAETVDRWQVCTGSAVVPKSLEQVAGRIAARLARRDERVLVSLLPLGEGSTEMLLAVTTELIDQLRARLRADRVPLRTVDFQWQSERDPDPDPDPERRDVAAPCGGVRVMIEVAQPE